MLKKYKIKSGEAENAAREYHNVNGRTVFLTEDNLTDEDAETLMANGCDYFELAKQPKLSKEAQD